MAFHLFSRRVSSVLAAAALVVGGCSGDAAVAPPPVTDVSQTYWALTLDYHAVTVSTVAPYDTIRLTAIPRNAAGEPLSGLPAPTFTSTDLERVQVDADGLVHARKVGNKVRVVATLAHGNLVHADTVLITVTNTASPPVLATLSIHPVPPDSAKLAVSTTKVVAARLLKADSTAISGLAVYYTSTDPTTATIDRTTGRIIPVRPGTVTIIASATAYGITKADTLPYVVGYPVLMPVTVTTQVNASGQVEASFDPNVITIGTGGTVLIVNPPANTVAIDMTFDDPTNVAGASQYCTPFMNYGCDSGNIAAFGGDSTGANSIRARSFPVPGTYPFRSTIFGTTGTIVVVDEHAP
jgi:hypothetical protein